MVFGKQAGGNALRRFQRRFTVNQAGHFFGQNALRFGLGAAGLVGRLNRINLFHAQKGEIFQKFIHIGIGHFEPELVKLIRRGFLGIQPHRAAFGFAEFGAV